MAWTFPWASSLGVNFQFRLQRLAHRGATARRAVEYDYRREAAWTLRGIGDSLTKLCKGPVAEIGAMTGTDVATYTRDKPGVSEFVLESSTTPIPPMRVGWTASGACTGGSTAPPRAQRDGRLVAPPRRIRAASSKRRLLLPRGRGGRVNTCHCCQTPVRRCRRMISQG